jgi:(2Fe-2S) ferredoxin
MKDLMDKCCNKCFHGSEKPCRDYLACRLEGPLCHKDETCSKNRRNFIDSIIIPEESQKREILICAGTGCTSSGGLGLLARITEELETRGLSDSVSVKITGCHGFCEQGPLMIIEPRKTFYTQVQEKDVAEIVEKDLLGGELAQHLLYQDPITGERASTYEEVPFYARQ